jgi:transposase
MDWLPSSPDLNPIENARAFLLKVRLWKRLQGPCKHLI